MAAYIYIKDTQSRYVYANQSTLDLFRCTAESLAGCDDFRFFPAETARRLREIDARVLRGESTNEEIVVTAGGRTRTYLEVKTPIHAEDNGSPWGLLGISTDITAQKETEAQLRKLSRIVEQSPLSVVITDLNGAIEYVNPRFSEVSGYSAAEVIGQNPRLLKSGDTPEDVYREMWSRLTRGEVWSGELHNRRKSGEKYLENAVIAPVLDDRRRPTHYVAVKEDVTSQRRILELLERERQVSGMKTRFISVTSHEFRTPMAAAMGSVELLTNHFDRVTPAKRSELLDRIAGALRRMSDMLDEILLYNRLDAGRVELHLMAHDLAALIQNAVEEIRLIDHDAHRFAVEVTGATAGFVTDASHVQHILSNLLANAVRYSPAGSLVTVRLTLDEKEARLEVQDEGVGIPAADLPRLFQPFERGSNVGTIKGTGLGLSIVKRMIEQLGGTVAVESPAGGGTRFIVRHPRQPAPPASP
jgi:PAS domain S-box-containing protein